MGVFYDDIKSQCDEIGISISELCKEARIDRTLMDRWRIKDPSTLVTLGKINKAIETLKGKKEADDGAC